MLLLTHWEIFVFYFGGGHQSVRDRTAQAGTPIFKFSVFIQILCHMMVLNWIFFNWFFISLFLNLLFFFLFMVHVHNIMINFWKTDGVLVMMGQLKFMVYDHVSQN